MRILVTTVSRHGATSQIGDVIGDELTQAGHQVTRRALDEDEAATSLDTDGQDAVVLGGSVYTGSWLPGAVSLQDRLLAAGVPTYAFAVGVLDISDNVTDPRWSGPRTADNAKERVVFGGRITKEGLSVRERSLLAVVRAKEGEYTDWDAVRSWSSAVATEVSRVGVGEVP